ncbi:MAG: prepilin-type N-terminal cleavage/methylation domain-containing protein [Proteobacteria bacterium]|nr:prepilin-type N-terminal cleavage/methylation domain-containing protein [Pseudomonadota bacterium]MDA0926678.1 prepilin-type N-terminal cleavage/methylation domain-containing protein [Pseudomonadota bacterium]
MTKNIIRSSRAFTLLELLITVAIVGLLSAIALPSYQEYRDRVDVGLAIADLQLIDQKFEVYYSTYDSFPSNLAVAGLGGMRDPWGNPYQYLLMDENTTTGQKRKDKFLNPVNTDYDLYSMGKDGASALAFTSAKGRDDVVRANNGSFLGLAEDY